MLRFNPKKRMSVEDALEHEYLREVRAGGETSASDQVFLQFELEPELDENHLRKYFIMEIQKFHPHVQMPEKLLRL
jgi:mitogen-activated protein kinase 1/3